MRGVCGQPLFSAERFIEACDQVVESLFEQRELGQVAVETQALTPAGVEGGDPFSQFRERSECALRGPAGRDADS
jgi:hypothetical protein